MSVAANQHFAGPVCVKVVTLMVIARTRSPISLAFFLFFFLVENPSSYGPVGPSLRDKPECLHSRHPHAELASGKLRSTSTYSFCKKETVKFGGIQLFKTGMEKVFYKHNKPFCTSNKIVQKAKFLFLIKILQNQLTKTPMS